MPDKKIVFIDTAPFIYLVENNLKYAGKVEQYISECFYADTDIITSVISYMEFCLVPIREKKPEVIKSFEQLLLRFNVPLEEINLSIAQRAARLRAKYIFLRGLDALQLSAAIENGCKEFLTNDFNLAPISEIKIVIVEKWKG